MNYQLPASPCVNGTAKPKSLARMKSDNNKKPETEFAFRAGTTEFRLRVEDCITAMRKLDEQSIDVVVTSPPYNLGIKYANYNDRRASADYLLWSMKWA